MVFSASFIILSLVSPWDFSSLWRFSNCFSFSETEFFSFSASTSAVLSLSLHREVSSACAIITVCFCLTSSWSLLIDFCASAAFLIMVSSWSSRSFCFRTLWGWMENSLISKTETTYYQNRIYPSLRLSSSCSILSTKSLFWDDNPQKLKAAKPKMKIPTVIKDRVLSWTFLISVARCPMSVARLKSATYLFQLEKL